MIRINPFRDKDFNLTALTHPSRRGIHVGAALALACALGALPVLAIAGGLRAVKLR